MRLDSEVEATVGMRRRGSRSFGKDLMSDFVQKGGVDAIHLDQVLNAFEWPMFFSVFNNTVGNLLRDAPDAHELGWRGGVDVDLSGRQVV